MGILLNNSALNAYFRHTFAAAPAYPFTLALKFVTSQAGTAGVPASVGTPANVAQALWFYLENNAVGFYWGSVTSWGSTTDVLPGGQTSYWTSNLVANTSAPYRSVFVVFTSNTSATIYSEDHPTGRTFNPSNALPGEFASCTELMLGAHFASGAASLFARVAVAELAFWTDARTSGNATSYIGNTPAETINPASIYEVWTCNPAGAAGSAAPSTLTGIVNGRTMTLTGSAAVVAYQVHPVTRSGADTTPPTITSVVGTGGVGSSSGSFSSTEAGTAYWKLTATSTPESVPAYPAAMTGWTSQAMSAGANTIASLGTTPGTHFLQVAAQDAAATPNRVAAPVVSASFTITAPPVSATSMTIALKQSDGTTAAASITGIHWAILNAATIGAATAVLAAGTGESTDGSGNLVLDVTGLGLTVGSVRYVVAGKSNGTPGADFDGWHGPVTAA